MAAETASSTLDWRRLGTAVDHIVVWTTSCVVRFVVLLCTTSPGCLDRPRSPVVVSALPVDELPRFYLATGLTGRLDCPYTEDPPDSLVVWTKDGRPLDAASWRRNDDDDEDSDEGDGRPRVRLARGGTLVFTAASTRDEGVYACLVYSPLHTGPESTPFRVLVRGKWNMPFSCVKQWEQTRALLAKTLKMTRWSKGAARTRLAKAQSR